jgi:DNA-binding GntR family transcriptional regulator
MTQGAGRAPHRYRRIAGDLRARIEAGEFPVGSQLPSIAELKAHYGVAKATADAALDVLRGLGLVETRHGAGTFVIRDRPGESQEQQLGERVTRLREDLATLAARVEALQDGVSRGEDNLIGLYGKLGYDYPGDQAGAETGQRGRAGGL